MKLNALTDLKMPQEPVFAAVSDFSNLERQALRRNVDVTRTDAGDVPGVGAGWILRFEYRGRKRIIHAKILAFDGPNRYTLEGRSDGLILELQVELIPMSPTNTRLSVAVHFTPTTLASRMMVRSLWFVRRRLNNKLAARLEQFGKDTEERYR